MNKKQKLELTWIGKDEQAVLEPRILIEDPEKSYGDPHSDNMLIHGDNLLALKALEQKFAGKVKCIYIDPPFNTGEMFDHYDDGIEHSLWLNKMRDRLICISKLLSSDGTLIVHIDDNEQAYLTVLLDEIFGRTNRAYIVTFKQGSATGHKAINPGCVSTTNFLLIYAKDKHLWNPKKIYTARGDRDTRYNQVIVNRDSRFEDWDFMPITEYVSNILGLSLKEGRKKIRNNPQIIDGFVLNNPEQVVRLARPDYNAVSEDARRIIDLSLKMPDKVFLLKRESHSDMFFIRGERILFYKDKLKFIDGQWVAGEPLTTLWDDLLSNNLHKEGGVKFPKGKKPEHLLKRCFELSTDQGDLIMDSFLGSGTTAAVAHKMGRRWIGVELGDHCDSHCVPRLQQVCNGTDQDGISKAVEWKGGGGFKYYDLAPSLLKKDSHDNYVISEEYNADMLAAAMAKQEGFLYQPDREIYWKQGVSSEKDYIFTTTNHVTVAMLDMIAEEMAEDEHLLICCKKFSASCEKRHPNIQVKKIPQVLMGRCEFGEEDYSFNIVNLTDEASAPEFVPEGPKDEKPKKKETPSRKRGNKDPKQMELF
ncbi:MAG: site-specific DNA-methyltransferase [Spartobacteria bacterium]|nr:site-specific DNA-methyltransferase [Spartobacteria bacterium]